MSALLQKTLCAALLVLIAGTAAAADPGEFTEDGWYTWRVAAIDNAPSWCCIDWRSGRGIPQTCDLNNGSNGYSDNKHQSNTTGQMQIYALMHDGETVDIRTLSPQCPISAPNNIHNLGTAATPASLRWLNERLKDTDLLASSAMAAIATHRGDGAVKMLVKAAKPSAKHEHRKDAIFWMGQLRVNETTSVIQNYMFEDGNAAIREHAAFSWSQSAAVDRAGPLIRQGREDTSPEVRSQAWFWLAQTAAPEAEVALGRALVDDADRDVQEAAVFALSQLPEERGVNGLLAVLENTTLDRRLREQALFWLAESESDVAFEKIRQLLAAKN